ncbi:MAG: hypothetical protein K9M56_07220 [Victivallales bacterium]|nr:hypothetical protein [Victivallales bacterium]
MNTQKQTSLLIIIILLISCRPVTGEDSKKDSQFPGSESYPQLDGVKHKREPEFPDSNSFKKIKYNYAGDKIPREKNSIFPKRFTNIKEKTAKKNRQFPGSGSYPGNETYHSFPRTKQFPTIKYHENQYPASNKYPDNETYRSRVPSEKINVKPGGYELPQEIHTIKNKKKIDSHLKKKSTNIER